MEDNNTKIALLEQKVSMHEEHCEQRAKRIDDKIDKMTNKIDWLYRAMIVVIVLTLGDGGLSALKVFL